MIPAKNKPASTGTYKTTHQSRNSKYKILLEKQASKQFSVLTQNKQKKLSKVILKLEVDPLNPTLNIKKLKGSQNSWRVRVGDLRVLYTFDPQKEVLLVFKIGFRGSMY